MCFEVVRGFFMSIRVFYRHVGPKGPKEGILSMELAGDRPPRYGEKTVLERSRGTGPRATVKNASFTVGRGPVPRHASH